VEAFATSHSLFGHGLLLLRLDRLVAARLDGFYRPAGGLADDVEDVF
jgi:hypothetical protein